jgi:hypothetical protein
VQQSHVEVGQGPRIVSPFDPPPLVAFRIPDAPASRNPDEQTENALATQVSASA